MSQEQKELMQQTGAGSLGPVPVEVKRRQREVFVRQAELGRFQTYGTQIADVVDGQPVPWPGLDPERLDERRAAVGIEPFARNAARYT